MPFKKQTHTPDNVTLLAAASRIASGELTRSSAAAELGVSLPYLVQWLGKNGLLDSLKHTRGNAGTHSNPDKVKAYAVLVDKAAASPKLKIAPLLKTGTFTSDTGQVLAFAGLVNYQVLARRIKAHREELAALGLVKANDDSVEALKRAINTTHHDFYKAEE